MTRRVGATVTGAAGAVRRYAGRAWAHSPWTVGLVALLWVLAAMGHGDDLAGVLERIDDAQLLGRRNSGKYGLRSRRPGELGIRHASAVIHDGKATRRAVPNEINADFFRAGGNAVVELH